MNLKLVPTQENTQKWLINTGLFFAPLAILYLVFVQANITSNGFQVTDFIPTSEVIGGMILYAINTVLDYLRKLKA